MGAVLVRQARDFRFVSVKRRSLVNDYALLDISYDAGTATGAEAPLAAGEQRRKRAHPDVASPTSKRRTFDGIGRHGRQTRFFDNDQTVNLETRSHFQNSSQTSAAGTPPRMITDYQAQGVRQAAVPDIVSDTIVMDVSVSSKKGRG